MRLNAKKAALGAGACLALWLIFTYVSFAYSPLERETEAERDEVGQALAERLQRLEDDFDRHLRSNKQLLLEIKQKILQHKNQAAMDVNIPDEGNDRIAVLVIACNRVTVQRCIDRLIKFRTDKQRFPIVISQDGNHEATRIVLESYANAPDSGVTLIFQPDLSDIPVPPKEKKFRGYFNIARHYKFALNHTFHTLGYDAVIIVEDDLDVSQDFYEYFSGTYPLLKRDPTLWCVSAWNDNGKPNLINKAEPALLHRTDFFPGLGWMLTKNLWNELQPKWPKSYWDDWIRKPEQRNGRACIRPELPRTITFGKIGVSNGLFFEKYLKLIELNDQDIKFTQLNLNYLMKEEYDKQFIADINAATNMTLAGLQSLNELEPNPSPPSVRVVYHSKEEYKHYARQLGLMEDFRSGVGRTAYLGAVNCFYRGRRVYITPVELKSTYDTTWN